MICKFLTLKIYQCMFQCVRACANECVCVCVCVCVSNSFFVLNILLIVLINRLAC